MRVIPTVLRTISAIFTLALAATLPASAQQPQPVPGKMAEQVYKNIQSTPDASAGSLAMAMSIFAGALGVGCEHCHVPGHWDSDKKPAKVTAQSKPY